MMTIDMQQMSREQKLRLMHELWEDLARAGDEIESPAWHEEALRETEQRVLSGVEQVRDWEEAKAELRRRAR